MKPGGTEGGTAPTLVGFGLILMALGFYFFFDSVRVSSADYGWISGRMGGGGGHGMGETTSMGVLFVPFLLGVAVLFFDAKKIWAWLLAGAGLVIIAIEILSRIRFVLEMKTTSLLLILGMIAAGAGLLARGYLQDRKDQQVASKDIGSD